MLKINETKVPLHSVMEFLDIMGIAGVDKNHQPLLHSSSDILGTKGKIEYQIQEFKVQNTGNIVDAGMFYYNYGKTNVQKNFQLKFCVTNQSYCSDKACNNCAALKLKKSKTDTVGIVSVQFSAAALTQIVKQSNPALPFKELLSFKRRDSFQKTLFLNCSLKDTLDKVINEKSLSGLNNIFINAQMQLLLMYTIETVISFEMCELLNCKFLSSEADREKVMKAREVLIDHLYDPITIKELSRKVAMNECYLKRGFKQMFGTTIFEFYQTERMQKARQLLYDDGKTVTDVAHILGYSSISHFSTAFKKQTGLKPCELLLR